MVNVPQAAQLRQTLFERSKNIFPSDGNTSREVDVFVLIAYIRSIVLYLLLILVVRLMGKRQIAEMEPAEFVVTMLLANLAAVPMQDNGIPLVSGIVPIVTILAMELILAVLSMRSVTFRRLFCGRPEILIREGKIDQAALRRSRITADELTELLRQKDITDLTTIQYAILETNGMLSTLLYPKHSPAAAKDAGVQVKERVLPVTIISDGHLMQKNLPLAGVNRSWVEEKLRQQQLQLRDVFLMTLEPGGKLYLARKERRAQ